MIVNPNVLGPEWDNAATFETLQHVAMDAFDVVIAAIVIATMQPAIDEKEMTFADARSSVIELLKKGWLDLRVMASDVGIKIAFSVCSPSDEFRWWNEIIVPDPANSNLELH